MDSLRSSAPRAIVAAILMLVLTLAGVGRGLAAVSDRVGPGFGLEGVATPICHSGAGEGSVPPDHAPHDCCDACVLLAPAMLTTPPSLSAPASVALGVVHVRMMARNPQIARPRSPRQSQGPPTA